MQEQLFVEERHAQIVEYLDRRRKAGVAELCDRFGVSGATMRNDLRTLEANGQIVRSHGGAMRATKTGRELDSIAKEVENRDAKVAIARAALDLVEDGDTIVLDTGTTTLELARLLGARSNITVVTNDLAIAIVLEEHPGVTIVFAGGVVRKRFHCTVAFGDAADPVMAGLAVDKAFMGTNAFSVGNGASTPDLGTAHAKGRMIAMASAVVLLCDSSKFETSSFARFAPTDSIDTIVTEEIDPELRDELAAAGVAVVVAKERSGARDE